MSMLSAFGPLPTIRTRKALLLLDFQNDFVRPNGALHVANTVDFLDQLPQLAQAFRSVGDVIWVRSHFDSPRPLLDPDSHTECIVLSDAPIDAVSHKEGSAQTTTSTKPGDEAVTLDEEAFLSSDQTHCCRTKTTGIQFPAPIVAAIDADRDTVLEKSDYSALKSESLILSFRQRFVTELYLCGSLSNISVYATALDAARHGFAVTLVEDCLGFRSFARHEAAMRRMADILGASGISMEELYEELDWQETDAIARSGGSRPARSVTPAGIEGVMDSLGVQTSPKVTARPRPPNQSTEDSRRRRLDVVLTDPEDSEDGDGNPIIHLAAAKSSRRRYGPPTGEGRNGLTENKKIRARARRTKRPDSRADSVPQPERRAGASPKSADKPLGPGDTIGEGDSRILYDLDVPDDAFAQIREEVAWQKMYHLSGEVPRLVAVQGQLHPDGSNPIYRHPADESPPLLPFSPTVDEIRIEVERILGHPLNHVLIQLYRDGQDRISEHSDKTLDIVHGSFICNISLGAQRVMILRTKSSAVDASAAEGDTGRHVQRIPLPHESLFILGEKTNMKWLHGIRPDKRPDSAKSNEELAFGGERISLTFRQIGTFIDPVRNTIWGQGAVAKTHDQARPVIHGDPAETERLIRAFGQENRATEFDWAAVYGDGFDVVNFVTTSPARLIPSGDPVADLRVKLCLKENGLRYTITPEPEDAAAGTVTNDVRPLYVDSNGTTVAGDVNILSHLARRSPESARPGVKMLQGGHKLAQIDEVLTHWRAVTGSDTPADADFCEALNPWEETLRESTYIAGAAFGIDDCSLWPVLRDIVQQSQRLCPARYPNLNLYYHRVAKRGCVKTLLEEGIRSERSEPTEESPALV